MDWIQFAAGLVTILGGMFAMMRFLTRDLKRDVDLHQKKLEELSAESKVINMRLDQQAMRLDGLYKVLLDKVYGNTKP